MGLSKALQSFFGVESQKVIEKKGTASQSTSNEELSHINQEMYKRSAELAERNRGLSLLQRINEFVLTSFSHPNEIAQHVIQLIISEVDFPYAAIFIHDKNKKSLIKLARGISGDISVKPSQAESDNEILMSNAENLIVQSVTERRLIYTPSLNNVIKTNQLIEDAQSVFISHLYVRNELIGAIVIVMREPIEDISEYRKLFLSQLSELVGIGMDNSLLYNQVQTHNARLRELDKLKDEFVSVASHELRTPMTAIKSYLWMALDGKGGILTDKQRYYIQRGYNSVDRLIRLVNDMLNISRIESGRIVVTLKPIDLQQLAQEIIDEVTPRAQEVGVTVKLEKQDDLLIVMADADKIKEVFMNLIGNSLKFTPKDGTISIKFTSKNDIVETAISDTGIGIEPEDMNKLFQKFGLLAGSYTINQSAMGTGLGLYICKSIIAMHHGDILAASEGRNKGTTFTFTLHKASEHDMKADTIDDNKPEKEDAGLIHTQM